jgi:hypothetical protein
MIMKKITIFISVLLVSINLNFAQNLLIKYDMITKNTDFFRVGKNNKLKKVKRPYIKENEVIRVELLNYNTNYWAVDVKKTETTPQTMDANNSFDALTSFFSVYGKFISTVNAANKGEKSENCEENTILLNTVYAKLFELKYNSKLSTDSIKARAKSIYQEFLTRINSDIYKLPAMNIAEPSTIKPEQMNALSNSMMSTCPYTQMYAMAKGTSKIKSKNDPLFVVNRLYNEIMNTDYTYRYSLLAGSNDIHLSFNFKRSPLMVENVTKANNVGDDEYDDYESIDSASIGKILSTEIFSIPTRGGIQISNSMGLSFSYIGNQRKEYFFMNDSILSENNDTRIVPLVNSMLNFYQHNNASIKFGGSVGVGVAVQEKLQMHYMFGLSCILGQSERIVLSTGLVLSPVERLAKGYHVNEIYQGKTIDDISTKTIYLPGYYFSISFSLSGKKPTTSGSDN